MPQRLRRIPLDLAGYAYHRFLETTGRASTLVDLRRRAAITQQAIAEVLHKSGAEVSRFESGSDGRADHRIGTVRAYIEALGLKLTLVVSRPDGSMPVVLKL